MNRRCGIAICHGVAAVRTQRSSSASTPEKVNVELEVSSAEAPPRAIGADEVEDCPGTLVLETHID
jgi:hypothetical protein